MFYCLDAATGHVNWRYDTGNDVPDAQFHGDVLIVDNTIVVGSDARPTGFLCAFDVSTGDVRWKRSFPGGVPSSILRRDSSVLAVTAGSVVAMNIETGAIRWEFTAPAEAPGIRHGDAALSDKRLYVAWRPGFVDALDTTTGRLIWRRPLGAALNTSITRVGDRLLVGAMDGKLHGVDQETGSIVSTFDIGGTPIGDIVFC